MGDVQIHPMLTGDVILGAKNLAKHLPLAMPASSPASWEWRAFAEGQNTSNRWRGCHEISSLQAKWFCYLLAFLLTDSIFFVVVCGCFQAIRCLWSPKWRMVLGSRASTVQVNGIACQPTSQQCSKVHCAMENLWPVCSSQGVWACTWWPTWRTEETMEGYRRDDVFFLVFFKDVFCFM